MNVFKWLNDQLLRMDWLAWLVGRLVEDVFGIDMAGRTGASVHFFIYDVIKIFILLAVLIFTISWVQSHFPPERTRRILGGMQGFSARLAAALLGTITPFCSCSSIPLFIGFTSSGLPLGVTFAFLISSPLVDLASVILLASIFNWTIAIAYVLVGLVLAVIGGTLIGRARMERYVESFVMHSPLLDLPQEQLTVRDRLQFSCTQVSEIFARVWLYVLIGVGIGAAIHNWIPAQWTESLLGPDNWWSVPLATLIGVPMYADIFGTLPIAEALVANGVGLGTALAFMMAVTALSLPSLIMLKKVVQAPLLALFFTIITLGIILIGYLFNAYAYLFV
ncbi:permease [Candidatus Accumulibacter sp. ACC007]|uniref:permease n=1 Tax=Candidatus Accumulibacter sp. ACC007 TaxID=2823333 RepID=UPI0025B9FA0E|nr:permease [Candidatus Accumulibacter sp. ACC007]